MHELNFTCLLKIRCVKHKMVKCLLFLKKLLKFSLRISVQLVCVPFTYNVKKAIVHSLGLSFTPVSTDICLN